MANNCSNCNHFDKGAYPGNPMFGRCEYHMPKLPFWAARQISDAYIAIDKNTEFCQTHSPAKPGADHE
jgi:hypothetical protein